MSHDGPSNPRAADAKGAVSAGVFSFDHLKAGMILGRHEDRIDEPALANWRAIYGGSGADDPDARVPSGFAAVLIMRAYLSIVSPRPPGNIHRLLALRTHAPLPRNQCLQTTVVCVAKEMRGERRYVRFSADCRCNDGALVVVGALELLWAA